MVEEELPRTKAKTPAEFVVNTTNTVREQNANKTDFLPSKLLPFNIKYGKDFGKDSGISDFDFSSTQRVKKVSATIDQDISKMTSRFLIGSVEDWPIN